MADVPGLMKQYGYFDDGAFQPEVAQMALDAAKEYLRIADVREPEQPSSLYDLACYMLAAHWYDNRGVVAIGTTPQGEIAKGLQAVIWMLAQPGGESHAADG